MTSTANDVAAKAAELAAAAVGVGFALQMNLAEAGLAVTIVGSAASLIYKFSRVERGLSESLRALRRLDRRAARLEKNVFGIDPADDEADLGEAAP
jgi:hypothetical protein